MAFSRQEYWRGLPFPSPGDLPDLGIEPGSPALQADSLLSESPGNPHRLAKKKKDIFQTKLTAQRLTENSMERCVTEEEN